MTCTVDRKELFKYKVHSEQTAPLISSAVGRPRPEVAWWPGGAARWRSGRCCAGCLPHRHSTAPHSNNNPSYICALQEFWDACVSRQVVVRRGGAKRGRTVLRWLQLAVACMRQLPGFERGSLSSACGQSAVQASCMLMHTISTSNQHTICSTSNSASAARTLTEFLTKDQPLTSQT